VRQTVKAVVLDAGTVGKHTVLTNAKITASQACETGWFLLLPVDNELD